MISRTQDGFDSNAGVTETERTLRLIAAVPAPQGLEERVKARLQARSRGSVVAWPFGADGRGWISRASLRPVAAAAIVLVVAGGGWGVYSHIQVAATPSAIVLPLRQGGGAGGFSAAGATRKPQTLEGPTAVTTKQESVADSSAVPTTTGKSTKAAGTARHAQIARKQKSKAAPQNTR